MNSKHTFYPGEENLKAYQSLQSYIDNPAGDVLFVLGPPSSGKTLLLHAVVHKMRSSTDFEVKMLTVESLKNGLMTSIKDGTTDSFWADLLKPDILLIDDCQFASFIDDVIVQLSEIYQRKGKRLVLAGDYLSESLRVIPNLKVLELVRPAHATRRIILQEKLQEKDLVLEDALTELISERIKDPRQIVGFVSWLSATQDYS